MTNALIAAVQGMQNDIQYMDTIANNMVNIATTGYKRTIPVVHAFSEALHTAGAAGAHAMPLQSPFISSSTLPPIVGNVVDASNGPVKQTGQPFDVAITGNGFFELATPDGPAYSRAGNFHLDASGRLLSEAGFAVQGVGGDIVLNGSIATIDRSGQVTQDGESVGQIKVVQFPDSKAMIKTANGLLEPANPAAVPTDTTSSLQVGYLEGSNVAPMREMISVMETVRHFESSQKLFQSYDDMLGTAIQKLGEF
jgi:flagellar basal-body rod protein FlgF